MPVLTDASVRKYKPTKARREIRDSQSPLRLIIQPSGAKSWALRFRKPDGSHTKFTLGAVYIKEPDEPDRVAAGEPTVGGILTLAEARRLAAKVAQERAARVDVVAARKKELRLEREQAQDAAANTFGKLLVQFFIDHRVRRWGTRPRRWRGDAATLGLRWPKGCTDPSKADPEVIKGGLADTWRDKPVNTIDGHDIHGIVDEARKLGIPGLGKRNKHVSENRGRKMHASLSVFFRWLVRQRKVTVNPVQGVWSPGAPPARDRKLTDAEIRQFWLATEQIGQPVRALLQVLLLTGARLNEVRGMLRVELDESEGRWIIGGNRTKNHRPHTLTLPQLVRDLIADAPVIEKSPFVFTTTGTSPVWIGSKVKRTIDEAMGPDVPRWTLHDLRRSCASGMQRLGIQPAVIERCLNHVSGSFGGIAGVYQVDPLEAEVAAALKRWSEHVIGLVEGSDKVVPLRKERVR